jgi:uncharacterized protein
VDFLVYSRAAPGAASLEHDPGLDEEHWDYMDRFASGMVARGPTLAPDRATWTGSLHILDLPGVDAARRFVEREPYNRAGLFGEHLIRGFRNRLGRTMWESPSPTDDPRFFVIARGQTRDPGNLDASRLIVWGDLLPVGFALALQAPSRQAATNVLGGVDAEVFDWELGGRR